MCRNALTQVPSEVLKRAPEVLKRAPEALKKAPEALKKEFKDFHLAPAARAESDEREADPGEGGGGGSKAWLRNLVNGFDVEIPTGARLQDDTVGGCCQAPHCDSHAHTVVRVSLSGSSAATARSPPDDVVLICMLNCSSPADWIEPVNISIEFSMLKSGVQQSFGGKAETAS